jgi:ribosomal protein S12 methylthiotransferase
MPALRNSKPTRPKGTCSIISLGCPKNLVDSERMLGLLEQGGYRTTPEPEGADLVIVNTCGFLRIARQESLQTIRQMLRLKKRGKIRGVIVAGCLAQRDKEKLFEQCPGIDQVVGVFGRDEIALAADRLIGGRPGEKTVIRPPSETPLCDGGRRRLTPRHLAYLRIAEGCDRLCTFCSIPDIRGRYASKPLDQVVAEAEQLVADGARELILIAQDTSRYGLDRGGEPQLARLLARLDQLDGLAWLRLMYLYPMHVGKELIEVLASGRKILPYLDLPLQHINDAILRGMKRQVGRADTERLLDRLRGRIPGLVLRTTLMTGFPGETDEQFEELYEFVAERRFERLGVFVYSREPDTPASRLPDQVAPEVAEVRRERLMTAQQEVAFAWGRSQVGRQMDILIDSCIPDQRNAFMGRSFADAPEVDGAVYVTGEGLAPGRLVPCEIAAAREYDLIAVAVGEPR